MRIFDCFMYFDEDLILEIRLNILNEYVDYFVICESRYDHKNNIKKLNFDIRDYESKKIKYIILDKPFPNNIDIWKDQAIQREHILKNLRFAQPDDYIFFSDPDEIIRPELLVNFNLREKYGIFLHDCFNYKLNLFSL